MAQIGTVYVPALVIALNNVQFRSETEPATIIGKVMTVPCRDIEWDNEDSWAIPIKDAGIFTTIEFLLKQGEDIPQPTFDSFTVFRIRDVFNKNEWYIYGTKDDLLNSCNTCCDGDPVPMPGIDPEFSLRIAPTQILNTLNDLGQPVSVFGLPTISGNETYFPYGSYKNQALPAASATGYSTKVALLAFLNSHWTAWVWTESNDTITAVGGEPNSILGVEIIRIDPSA